MGGQKRQPQLEDGGKLRKQSSKPRLKGSERGLGPGEGKEEKSEEKED